jgi:hypothetical protein
MSVSTAQVTHPITSEELIQLLDGLQQRSALAEAGILLGCLALSWLMLRLWRGEKG